jgi:hypothetical protein
MRLNLELGHSRGETEPRAQSVFGNRRKELIDAFDPDALKHRRAVGVGVRGVGVLVQALGD